MTFSTGLQVEPFVVQVFFEEPGDFFVRDFLFMKRTNKFKEEKNHGAQCVFRFDVKTLVHVLPGFVKQKRTKLR